MHSDSSPKALPQTAEQFPGERYSLRESLQLIVATYNQGLIERSTQLNYLTGVMNLALEIDYLYLMRTIHQEYQNSVPAEVRRQLEAQRVAS